MLISKIVLEIVIRAKFFQQQKFIDLLNLPFLNYLNFVTWIYYPLDMELSFTFQVHYFLSTP